MADLLKVVVADDSQLLRKNLREELEKCDCEVIEVENGKGAVMEALQDSPDAIFLDIVMPEVNGLEALEVIRDINKNIAVVMVSSAGTPLKVKKALDLGAIEFIQKPFKSEQIHKVVETIRKQVAEHA